MINPQRRLVLAAALVSGLMAPLSAIAQAQNWPNRPIRLIVNFPPGSVPDVIGRSVSTPLAQSLGVPVVVENRAGAGGIVGADAAAKSANDGYTFLVAAGSTMVIVPNITARMPFNASTDLVPVAAGARVDLFMVVRANSPFQTLDDFIRHAKANPGRLNYGTPGVGTTPHVGAAMLDSMAGITTTHIPFQGPVQAVQELLAGRLDFIMDPGVAIQHIQAGSLRMLAMGGAQRSPLFPTIPTLHELGMTGFDGGATHSFYAPAGTPQPVIERMNREINAILVTPAVIQAARNIGAEITPMSPTQVTQVNAADNARFLRVIREKGITID
jgi:tripartite-type tricarboxylate transporter receptor subunit TctC